MLDKLKLAWSWSRAHWKWILGGVALVLSVIVGLRFAKKSTETSGTTSKIETAKSKVAFTQGEIAQLEVKKTEIQAKEATTEESIDSLGKKIQAVQDATLKARGEVPAMSADEKLKRFKKLGY